MNERDRPAGDRLPGAQPPGDRPPIAINARAALRAQVGGVERVARELVRRLPALAPKRYRVVAPPRALAHRAGHAWEQLALPLAARGSELLLSPANTAPLLGARNVVLVHDLAPLVEPAWYGRAYRTWHGIQLRASARRARLLLTPSEAVRDQLVELLAVEAARTAVVAPGVDPELGRAARPERVRARLGLARPYVLAVGTDTARKNLALLERAAPRLAGAGLDVVVAGGARPYMRPGSAAPPSPARASVRRLGYVPDEDLPSLYAGAAAFALPSLYEGFGLPCLEAMACGAPVVATRRGGLPEACGDAALYVEPGDATALADACVAAATDAGVRERLVAAGARRARTLTWDATVRSLDGVLAALLAELA